MKSILTFIMICLLSLLQAQKVEGYKYIVVPSAFSGFDAGQYQLNNYLKLLLTQKDYKVIAEETAYWPEEARLNPCQVIAADIKKLKSTFDNKLQVTFSDCNNLQVAALIGSSKIKEFEKGYKDALDNAMSKINVQNAEAATYRQEESKSVTIVTTTTDQQVIRPKGVTSTEKVITVDDFQRFSYNGQTVLIAETDKNVYVLTTPDKSKVLAHYYPSSLAHVFHVMVNQGNQKAYHTIGYYDGQTLWYEYSEDNESWTKIEFSKED